MNPQSENSSQEDGQLVGEVCSGSQNHRHLWTQSLQYGIVCEWLSPDKMYTSRKRFAQEYPLVEEAYHKVESACDASRYMVLVENVPSEKLFQGLCLLRSGSEAQWQSIVEDSQHLFAFSQTSRCTLSGL